MPNRAALLAVSLLLLAACSGERETPSSFRDRSGEQIPSSPGGASQPVSATNMFVRISPENPSRGTGLHLSASGFQPEDGEIVWLVDGHPAAKEGTTFFRTDALSRGKSVQARVTVGDRVLRSNVVTLLNSPPEIRSVKFVPEVFQPGESLGVEASGTDPDGDDVTIEYAWERNGVSAGTGSRIQGILKRGDRFSVTITPFDGKARGRSLTLQREVRNGPPTIEGVAEARMAENVYSCRVLARDRDGDPLTYALQKSPAGMSIEAATGRIRWEVPPDFRGRVPVAVSVSDGKGGEASYAMFVTILEDAAK